MDRDCEFLSPDRLVLLLINASNNGQIRGKTLLQKRAFFLCEALDIDLGFKAHYYGPYSPMLEEGLAQSKALGFVGEKTIAFGSDGEGFEVRRHDYELTEDGKLIVQEYKEQFPDQVKLIDDLLDKLAEAGDIEDYFSLSIAAKTYHIIREKNQPMNVNEIKEAAKELDWDVTTDSVDKAASFLEKMSFVSRT